MTNKINYEEVLLFLMSLVSDKTEKSINDINPDVSLSELNLDSLDVLDLTFEAELKYDITFPKESEALKTLSDVAALTFDLTKN
ncbi:MAG: phosphopantetheine-binding protein [Methylophilaceae bacterium]|nr:MAG: phosphopantetheine-binding protein [Methylophilaceae bacterium]